MCIPIEFWLDGLYFLSLKWKFVFIFVIVLNDYDCMDWTDELAFDNYNGDSCLFEPNPMNCDDHICLKDYFSCGNGQCIYWLLRIAIGLTYSDISPDCYNKRHLNYMCEVSIPTRAWTLESGLCWIDRPYNDSRYPPWNIINSSRLSNDEIFVMNVCSSNDSLVRFPPTGLINPNLSFYYDYRQLSTDRNVKIMEYGGSL
ncbi:unnamed protein product [Adineta steineri]|uniref:Uncharacterized protein n=1 Tax=Adineta steineri TaxID=433720 RepID=A0A814L8L4_9BILA|nr:unnamed protein product [Adineta steineri]CAF1061320.1 unnamed protein product [Adineta steineri]CAF4083787.1 unnamed protein product [Adineta steineri]CAF4136906.1 unnamed protein product [Adineta steineri]